MAYGDVLTVFFPRAKPFVGRARGTSPLACAILGSNLIGINEAGRATWQQAIGTLPIPPLNFVQPNHGPKHPPMGVQGIKDKCSTPQVFRTWLNWAASKILQLTSKGLLNALNTDNWMPHIPFTLQQVHDLYMIGATPEMIFPDPLPILPWRVRGFEPPNSYAVTVFSNREMIGSVGLAWKNGRWVYGGQLNNGLKFKHSHPPSHVDLRDVRSVMRAATRLYLVKSYEWLLDEALNYPEKRGAV